MKLLCCIYLSFFLLLNLNLATAQTTSKQKTVQKSKKNIIQKKELVYLYAANGGMIGYFSDGSVVGCPRCDFCKSNILAMFKKKSSEKWNLKKPNDFTSYEEDNGWVLVNYKWNEKVPQF